MAVYFAHLYPDETFLLVASAEQLFLMNPDGTIKWTSDTVGLDGVIVDRIEGGVVYGGGEWDPPGGWRPFQVSLDTGELF